MNKFKELGLSDLTIEALEKKGYKEPTTIQSQTIPLLLAGEHDVIGQAQTGTGKTACFALPILEGLKDSKKPQAIILAPTRELAVQVTNEIKSLKGKRNVNITTIYGGASIRDQMKDLERGVDIVVGTPGRVMDLMNRRKLDISEVSFAVLDEADEMLNMGFIDDIEDILKRTNNTKKMLLFSATMPSPILHIAKRFMHNYKLIKTEGESLATQLIDQIYFDINGRDRYAAIKRIVAVTPEFHGIIFCKTRKDVDMLAHKLSGEFESAALHGEVSQGQREQILQKFKGKKLNILIATDVAARGIDVNDLNVVINYSLPQSPEMYVHRIGRTGRAGKKGLAITFVIPSERSKLKAVERIIDQKISKAELPTIEDIIGVKKAEIFKVVGDMLNSGKKTEYDEIAKGLLSGQNPEKVVSCVLRYAFQNELDSNNYQEIGPATDSEKSGRRSSGRSGGSRKSGGRRDSRGGHSRGSRSRSSRGSGSRDDCSRKSGRSSERSGSKKYGRSSSRRKDSGSNRRRAH